MNPQISFFITFKKEQEFFDFVRTECNCDVLIAGDDLPICVLDSNGKTSKYSKYFFVPKEFADFVHYCHQTNDNGESVRCIDPSFASEELSMLGTLKIGTPYLLPYIEYMKTEQENEQMARCRLFADLSFLFSEHKTRVREIYGKMKKWIQKKATLKDTSDFSMKIYHIL